MPCTAASIAAWVTAALTTALKARRRMSWTLIRTAVISAGISAEP
ncbi:hypothetical protein ACH4NT_36910 [Streptomyces lydicus]